MSNLTKEWSVFNGHYEKKALDIKLKDGRIFENCWPNAGYFISLGRQQDAVVPDIPAKDVEFIRLTHRNIW